MDSLNSILSAISTVVWGPFILIPLLLGTGLWLTIRLGGLQFRALGRAMRHIFATDSDDESTEGDISNYQALTTALAPWGRLRGPCLRIRTWRLFAIPPNVLNAQTPLEIVAKSIDAQPRLEIFAVAGANRASIFA